MLLGRDGIVKYCTIILKHTRIVNLYLREPTNGEYINTRPNRSAWINQGEWKCSIPAREHARWNAKIILQKNG